MAGHLAAARRRIGRLRVLGEHDVAGAHPEGQAHRDRAVERGDPVVPAAEGPGDPDLGTLVPLAADDERDPPGPVEDPHPLVHGAGERDHPVHPEQVVVGQAEFGPQAGVTGGRLGSVRRRHPRLRCRVTACVRVPSEVDRSPVDGHGRLADDLRQGRVWVGRPADLPRGRLELEGQRRLGDEVRGVRSHDVDAERVPGLRVADHLGEALVLTADERLGDGLERDLADLVRRAHAPGTAAR